MLQYGGYNKLQVKRGGQQQAGRLAALRGAGENDYDRLTYGGRDPGEFDLEDPGNVL